MTLLKPKDPRSSSPVLLTEKPSFFGKWGSWCVLAATALLPGCGPTNTSPPAATASTGLPIPPETAQLAAGNQLRVVWVRTAEADMSDSFAQSSKLQLMGMETAGTDFPTMRPLLPDVGNYFRPLFLPMGKSVVFTDRSGAEAPSADGPRREPEMYLIEWPGGGKPVPLGTGVALATWQDPVDLSVWIYALEKTEASARGGLVGKIIVRLRPNNPYEREIVWAESSVEAQSFQLSQDGKRAVALIPAPVAARLNLEEYTYQSLGEGTWPSLAADNSYAAAVFNSEEDTWLIATPSEAKPWSVSLKGTAGNVWQPRWGSDPRFLVFSAGYAKEPDSPAYDPARDGVDAEIYLARMNAGGNELQSTVRLTNDKHGDYFPDVYSFGPVLPFAQLPQKPKDLLDIRAEKWPAHTATTAFAWEQLGSTATVAGGRECRVTPQNLAHYTRDLAMDLTRGTFLLDQASTDAWASSVAASHELTFEAIYIESFLGEENLSVKLAHYCGPDGGELMGLYRLDNRLVLRLRTDAEPQSVAYRLLDFSVGHDVPYHLLVTLKDGRIDVRQVGNLVGQITLSGKTLSCWKPGGKFQLGDTTPFGLGRWMGSAHQVGLYSSVLPDADLQAHAEAAKLKMDRRRPVDTSLLRAKFLGVAKDVVSGAVNLGAGQELVPLSFQVEKVVRGLLAEEEIIVWHWKTLNGVPHPDFPNEVGKSMELRVEALSQQHHLRQLAQFPEKPGRTAYFSLHSSAE